jgi:hypothetical protein
MESKATSKISDARKTGQFEALNPQIQNQSYEIVLGGGGIKGFGHIGLLKALEAKKIHGHHFTGISIGSIIATLYVNGMTPNQISELLCTELNIVVKTAHLEDLSWDFRSWVEVSSSFLSPYRTLWNLENILRELINRYNLKPQPNLRIIASNLFDNQPVIFEGTDYDLAAALAASCAFPLVMKPIVLKKGANKKTENKIIDFAQRFKIFDERKILIDGGIHHPHPGHFCKGPAIVSKLGFATKLPAERLVPAEYICHILELIGSAALDFYYKDPAEHIVVPTGMPDVAILSFALPKWKCEDMVEYGYMQAQKYLSALDIKVSDIETTDDQRLSA